MCLPVAMILLILGILISRALGLDKPNVPEGVVYVGGEYLVGVCVRTPTLCAALTVLSAFSLLGRSTLARPVNCAWFVHGLACVLDWHGLASVLLSVVACALLSVVACAAVMYRPWFHLRFPFLASRPHFLPFLPSFLPPSLPSSLPPLPPLSLFPGASGLQRNGTTSGL